MNEKPRPMTDIEVETWMAKSFLREKGIPYLEIDDEAQTALLMAGYKTFSSGKLFEDFREFAHSEFGAMPASGAGIVFFSKGAHDGTALRAAYTQAIPAPRLSFEYCAKAFEIFHAGKLGFRVLSFLGRYPFFKLGLALLQASRALQLASESILRRDAALAAEFGFPVHSAAPSSAPLKASADANTCNDDAKNKGGV